MATLTVYSDADPESTSVDGFMRGFATGNFATVRAGSGGDAYPSGASDNATMYGTDSGGVTFNFLVRSMFLFDTSSLTSSATISAATLNIVGTGKNNGLGATTPDGSIVSANPDSNTDLTAADFAIAKYGSTKLATDIAHADYSTSGYNTWTLNASGLASIDKTGVSKYALLLAYDAENRSISGPGGSYPYDCLNTKYADTAGTTEDPKLVVTYTLPSASRRRIITG